MNDQMKANLWSLLRLLLNGLAGYLAGRPESWAHQLAGGIVALTASWTVIDNKTNPPKPSDAPKPPNIAQNLSLFLAIGLVFVGCKGPESVTRFAAVARSVAADASIIYLLEHPEHRKDLQLVVDQLDISIAADSYTPARLTEILQPLKIRELSSKEGKIIIATTIIVYDALLASGAVAADPSSLKPLFVGLRDGFKAGLGAVK